MIKAFHRPEGVVTVNIATVTDEEWMALGLSQELLDEYRYREQLEAEFNDAHEKEIAALKKGIKNLTNDQRIQLLEHLIRKDLYRDGYLQLGVLG